MKFKSERDFNMNHRNLRLSILSIALLIIGLIALLAMLSGKPLWAVVGSSVLCVVALLCYVLHPSAYFRQ